MDFAYGYPGFPDAENKIDTLNIPQECLNALKRTGIEYIGDVLDVYVRINIGAAMDGFPRMSSVCYSVIFREIIVLDGCPWRDEIEDWLVKSVENH